MTKKNVPLSPRRGLALALSMLVSLVSLGSAPAHASRPRGARDAAHREPTATAKLGGIRFEANAGQADARAKFVARAGATTAFFGEGDATFVLRAAHDGETTAGAAVRMRFEGGAAREIVGEEELPGRTSYFVGSDPAKWRTNVVSYAKVRYREVWPGVDAVFYERDGKLEYDFEVAPGADAKRAAFAIEGAERVEVAEDGALVVETAAGELRHERPVVYQPDGASKREVASRYTLDGDGVVRFEVGDYDAARPLVIDPVVAFEREIGGNGDDVAGQVAIDAAGSPYIVGSTRSFDLPTNVGALDYQPLGVDALVVKLDPRDGTPVYFAYLGGSANDSASAAAADAAGRLVVVGSTSSADFPIAGIGTGGDSFGSAFVAKIGARGESLVFSSVVGGAQFDGAEDVALDTAGAIYVVGSTSSVGFPVVNAYQSAFGNNSDAFVFKLAPDGSSLVYSTFIGGFLYDYGNGIDVDALGRAYVVGMTNSSNFPTRFAPYGTSADGLDAFALRLSPSGSELEYSTYLGGLGDDYGYDIVVGAVGDVYVTGSTNSFDFPVVNALQATNNGLDDLFVTKLLADGTVGFSTLLGGTGYDFRPKLALAPSGNLLVTGTTTSLDFPTFDAIQPSLEGSIDAFVLELSASGADLLFSSYLDESGVDRQSSIAVDPFGAPFVLGYHLSSAVGGSSIGGIVIMKLDSGISTGAPEPPSDLVATGAQARIDLAWVDNSDDESGFKIERQSATGEWQQIAIVAANVNAFGDTVLDVGLPYTYRIRASSGLDDSGWSNEAMATATEPSVAPGRPTSFFAKAVSASEIELSWSGAGGETSFEIQRLISAAWQTVGTPPAGAASFVDGGLTPGVTYQYRMRAVNTAGVSPFTNTLTARIPAPTVAPTALTAGSYVGATGIAWSDTNAEEDGFKIERREGAGGEWQQIAIVGPVASGGAYGDVVPEYGVSYTYRVRAFNLTGDSSYSNEASASAIAPMPVPDFRAADVQPALVKLEWATISQTLSIDINIERRAVDETTFTRVIGGVPNYFASWNDPNVKPATSYVYRARAYHEIYRLYSEWVEIMVTTPPIGGGAVVTVTSTNDTNVRDAVVTLREAIMIANGQLAVGALTPGEQVNVTGSPSGSSFDEIHFAIGSGVQTIAVTAPLPSIVDRLLVDGTTQPGYMGTPLVALDGASVGTAGADGLVFAAPYIVARAIAVIGFPGDGIELTSSAATSCYVQDCYIGLDQAGAPHGNGGNGIAVRSATLSKIERNVVSGNTAAGVLYSQINSTSATIAGNRIGTNTNGDAATGNGTGIRVEGSSVLIGGIEQGEGNVVSGNVGDGIEIVGTTGNVVYLYGNLVGLSADGNAAVGNGGFGVDDETCGLQMGFSLTPGRNVVSANGGGGIRVVGGASFAIFGNLIGTNAAGSAGLGNNGNGITVGSVSGTIGHYTFNLGNVISGNTGAGIHMTLGSSLVIYGNRIGTAADALSPIGNGGDGIRTEGVGVTIGSGYEDSNVIANNGGAGVRVLSGQTTINRNRVYNNAGLAVDLGAEGPTTNDPGDVDTGPNDLQNAPVLFSVVYDGENLVVQGTLDSLASKYYSVGFFVTPYRGSGRPGDAVSYIGAQSVMTDGAGHATLVYSARTYVPAGNYVTAIVLGIASEFAMPVAVAVSGAIPGSDTPGVYVAATGAWFLRNQNAPGGADTVFTFGGGGALVPLGGDWNGDGDDTPGLYDPATGAFFLRNSSSPGPADTVFTFGAGGAAVAVTGDWDGNGTDTIGIYDAGTGAFFLRNTNGSGGADAVFTFGGGGAGLEPLAGDWNGDGVDTIGLYASATGAFFLRNANANGGADVVFGYGPAGVRPLVGDWDGM